MPKHFVKNGNDSRYNTEFFVLCFELQKVETNRILLITNIEKDDIIATIAWYMLQYSVNQITMRIYKADTLTSYHV